MSAEDTNSPSTPWFDGSVATAVQKANTDGSVLMVCLVQDSIEGSDSHIFESRFTNEAVAAELAEMNLIPLRLIKDSTDGTMFGQIFPIMVVPALYLIRNGMLSDFMNSSVDPDEMLERIRKAVAGHSQIPPPPAPVTPAPAVASTPISPAVPVQPLASPAVRAQPTSAVSESVSTSVTPTPSTPVPTPAAASQVPVIASVDSSSSASTRNAPARTINQADALKELMKERKLKREKEEREAEKKRELDRRSSSKTLTEAQADLKEKQAKKLKDKIEKDKREEIEYKKRVKQALEDDKARRRAEREKAQAAIAASAAQSSPLDSPVILPSDIRAQNSGLLQARNDAAPALAFESSRLNIRLFDGSSIRNTFKATDTLEQVRSWINANQEGDENAYNIVQLIPSRTFTDESKMLRDLELCPSATLVLKRTATSSSAYGGSGDGAVPTLMGYGWSALGLAGKLASSAYNTVSHYNPLSVANAIPPSSSTGGGSSSSSSAQSARSSQTAADKKKDKETSYNGATGQNNSNNNTAEKSATAALKNAHHYAQQQFIIKGHPYPSLNACAKAFYSQFSFKDHGSATDSFRASLRAIQKKHDWAAELLKNIDSAEFRKEEKLLRQSVDRLTRKRSHTIAGFADKQSDRLVRDTLVTNTTILREGNRILGDLTIDKLSSIQTHAEQISSSSSSSLRLKTPSISSESEEDNRSSIPFPRAPASKNQPLVVNPPCTEETPLKGLVTLKEDNPAEEQAKFKDTVGAFGCLNQPTTWKSTDGTIDLLSTFTSFLARRPRGPFIEHEYVADLSEGASFLNSLSGEEFSVALESQPATPLLVTNWSTVTEVFDRVLAPEFGFEEAYLAARKESMLDPVAEFVHSVLYSFGTYLQVDKSIPHSLNEREAFADITWPIIRGALRLAGIASRYLEVPIQGVDERKNAHRNLINEPKAHTHFADGVGLLDGGQAYLAEASVLFSPDPRKRHIDEYKLKRALRDTLISQIRRIAEESVPPSGTSVFGSTSFADKTKYYRLDFCGAFRLVQVGSMTVPITDSNFGGRMRRCLTSALDFAALIMQEKKQREGARDATMKERHEFARACTKIVRTTASPAAKIKKPQE